MPDPSAGGEPVAGEEAYAEEVELVEVVAEPEPDEPHGPDPTGAGEQRPTFQSRTAARERALGLLYEAEAKGLDAATVISALPVPPDPFTVELVMGVAGDLDRIDAELARVSHRWDVGRMPAIDRAVLRMATYELTDRRDVSIAVVINEAVELAKRFSTDDSPRFVNGVLSRLAADLRG